MLYLFYNWVERETWKLMISSSLAPTSSPAILFVSIKEVLSNIMKPASVLCYLCSGAENVFLFFLKISLLLNLREMELRIPGKTYVGNKN